MLAHSMRLSDGSKLSKGTLLDEQVLASLRAEGVNEVTAALPQEGDVGEDDAALQIAEALRSQQLELSKVGTGRVNLHARTAGLAVFDAQIINSINIIDPGITVATLRQRMPVREGQMVATVKIIPYAVAGSAVELAVNAASHAGAMEVKPFSAHKVGVISTSLPHLKEQTIRKTVAILEQRLALSGSSIGDQVVTEHDVDAVARELARQKAKSGMIIVFGASAISDAHDVIPQSIRLAGGTVERFGMPVDPGNLLLIGEIDGVPVIGAPGCARSPAENGFDFVLNRLLAGEKVTSADIAGMGVGGLLTEIGSRPQPREKRGRHGARIAAIILAAGSSRRMGADNKLLMEIGGKAMLRHCVDAALNSSAARTIVVTGHDSDAVAASLAGSEAVIAHNPHHGEGLSTSLKAGLLAMRPDETHALVMLADMPGVTSAMMDRLMEAARKAADGAIVLATSNGKRGNPVIWSKPWFGALSELSGDTGARHLVEANRDQVVEVEIGEAASVDVDTPEALAAQRQRDPAAGR